MEKKCYQCMKDLKSTKLLQYKHSKKKGTQETNMCKVYNQIGSLTTIKTHLHDHNIHDFKSINELITFQKNYPVARQQLIENSSLQIVLEKEILNDEIILLADFIDTCRNENTKNLISELEQLKHQLTALSSTPSNFFEKITVYFQRNSIQNKIRIIETNFDSKIANSILKYTDLYTKRNPRFPNIVSKYGNYPYLYVV